MERELREEYEDRKNVPTPPSEPPPPVDGFYLNKIHQNWATVVIHLIWALAFCVAAWRFRK